MTINRAAAAKGFPPRRVMSQRDANRCFEKGHYELKIPVTMPDGHTRNVARLAWPSVARYYAEGKK